MIKNTNHWRYFLPLIFDKIIIIIKYIFRLKRDKLNDSPYNGSFISIKGQRLLWRSI